MNTLAAALWRPETPLILGLALALSALFDLPSGAVIVWALASCGVLAAALPRPTAGLRT